MSEIDAGAVVVSDIAGQRGTLRPVRSFLHNAVLTPIHTRVNIMVMSEAKRITANLPPKLLNEACETTGKGITDTLIYGLELVRRSRAAGRAAALKGRLRIDVDLEVSRERTGR